MTLGQGQTLKQTHHQDGTPVDPANYVEHTYAVEHVFASDGYASQKTCDEQQTPGGYILRPKTYLVVLRVLE
jgi:hypothetical protein